MPPSPAELLASFLDLHDDSGLTLGARALTKHAVRSEWYGKVSGTPAQKGLHALVVLARILHQPVHQNVFALPVRAIVVLGTWSALSCRTARLLGIRGADQGRLRRALRDGRLHHRLALSRLRRACHGGRTRAQVHPLALSAPQTDVRHRWRQCAVAVRDAAE
jgi:hypothetical protein